MVVDVSDYAIPDDWGLKEAYNDSESVVHHGDTLYIAGTHSLRDVADDLLIPLHLVRNSQRYQQALAALQRGFGRAAARPRQGQVPGRPQFGRSDCSRAARRRGGGQIGSQVPRIS